MGTSGEQERGSWVVTMASASDSSEFEITEEVGLGYGETTPSFSSSSRRSLDEVWNDRKTRRYPKSGSSIGKLQRVGQ